MSKKITWDDLYSGKSDERFYYFRFFGIFLIMAFILVVTFTSIYEWAFPGFFDELKHSVDSLIVSYLFDEALDSLNNTEYSNISDDVISLLTKKCEFDALNYSIEDGECVVNAISHVFNNEYYIADFDKDGIKNCRDSAASSIYVLRKMGFEAWFVYTKGHVITVVRLARFMYIISDPSSGGIYLKDYIYGRLN